ncbi:MAG: ABC transporter ATP-binding protein [Bacteroidota bacterium]
MAENVRNIDKKQRPKITRDSLGDAVRMFKYLLPYRWYFIGAITLLVLGSLMMMAIMGLPGEMVNLASGKETRLELTLNQLALVMFVLLGFRALFSFVQTILFAHVSEHGMADVRSTLYQKLISQPMSYFEQFRVGELTSRITADVEQLQSVFSVTLAEFIRQILILLFGIVFLAWIMPRLFIVMLLTIPVVVLLAMVFGRYIRKLSKKRQDQLAKTNTIVEETLQNFTIVKAFANELFETKRYTQSVGKMVEISLSYARVRGLFFAFIIFLLFGSILFLLWQGAVLVQRGLMDSGDLLTFTIYTVMIGGAIASLGSLYTTIAGALGATERVKEMIDRDVELDISAPKSGLRILGNICFSDVHFSYPSRPEVPVLQGVNLDVKAGEKVALVGQSGSGKSTIIKLLMGFYELNSGEITVDAKPIADYFLGDFRHNIGIVPQEVILFGGSIRENLLYGRPDASEEEIREAAVKANCWDFIKSFPEGLDTVVGERGVKLSGGQKQRVAIARTILKDPSVLLLDEATSSLDAESERVVQEAMDKLMEGRTSIIIAHRLSTVRDVDRIYVLDQGRIAESGTHYQLIENPTGIYRGLAQLQFDLADIDA